MDVQTIQMMETAELMKIVGLQNLTIYKKRTLQKYKVQIVSD